MNARVSGKWAVRGELLSRARRSTRRESLSRGPHGRAARVRDFEQLALFRDFLASWTRAGAQARLLPQGEEGTKAEKTNRAL